MIALESPVLFSLATRCASARGGLAPWQKRKIEEYLREGSRYNFDNSNAELLARHFDDAEKESLRMNKLGLVIPSYEFCLKCSHLFNLLDARGAISVTERTQYIARVRNLAKHCAEAFYRQREEMGFPLLRPGNGEK